MITHPQNSFVRYLWISLVAHVMVVLFAYIVPKFFSTLKPTPKIVWVQLPQGIGYDIEQIRKAKQLPRSTIQEQLEALKNKQDSDEEKQAKEEPTAIAKPIQEIEKPTLLEEKPIPPKPEEKKPEPEKPKVVETPKPAPKKQPSALDKKIQAALNKNKQALKNDTEKKVPVEAAQVPEGGSGAGSKSSMDAASTLDPAYAQYYALIRERINREWVTAPKLFDESLDLKTVIVVMIAQDGTVTSIDFEESSGNYSFDLSAERAIERASPLPTPPPGLQEEAVNEGFLIEFSPTKVER